MKRRQFVGRAAAAATRAAAVGKMQIRPVTLDFRDPLRLAVNCMINRIDPARNYQPWFAVDADFWRASSPPGIWPLRMKRCRRASAAFADSSIP